MYHDSQVALLTAQKKHTLIGVLDQLFQQIELTESQYQTAQERYQSVGRWLSESDNFHLQQATIYAHGSVGLGTAVKPITQNEFDVDLVCFLPTLAASSTASEIKKLVGDRLKEHGKYEGMLEEKRRCWRINYANQFHLDITPSIRNLGCPMGGELVPDKQLLSWKATNPRGYMQRIERYAEMHPTFLLSEALRKQIRADVQPFPEPQLNKPLLKRIVQILKRHRDHMFDSPAKRDLAPISIIITTLAAWSYSHCVRNNTYTDTFELVVDVIRRMPDFIQTEDNSGHRHYLVENETTEGENFAEKWNDDPRLADTFSSWHGAALGAIENLLYVDGADAIAKHLSESFGATQEQIKKAFDPLTTQINSSRAAGSLLVAPTLGIVVTTPVAGAVHIRPNTFFGR